MCDFCLLFDIISHSVRDLHALLTCNEHSGFGRGVHATACVTALFMTAYPVHSYAYPSIWNDEGLTSGLFSVMTPGGHDKRFNR